MTVDPLGRAGAALLSLLLLSTPLLAEETSLTQGWAPKVLEPLDVFDLSWASSPRVAPDGKTIAYVRGGFDVMKDRRTARIWLMDADGARHRPLSDGPGFSPRFSPDGGRIAFLAPTEQGTELYMHWLADNRTARLSQLSEAPGNLTWAPDGRSLAFTMFKPKPAKPMAKAPTAPKGASWAPAFKTYEAVQYRADGQGYLREGFTHVYLMAAEGGAARQLTSGDFNHGGGIAFSRDGRRLYVSANRREDWPLETRDTDLFELELDSGTLTQLTDRFGPDAAPSVSPDGRYLAYVGHDDRRRGYENNLVYVRDLASGDTRVLGEDLDRGLSNLNWRDGSRALLAQYDHLGQGRVVELALDGRSRTLTEDLGGTAMSRPYSGGSFHAAGGTMAYTRSAGAQPAELAIITRDGPVTLTALNAQAFGDKTLASIEEIRFPSGLDGREIQAWVAKPPGFREGKRYPVILEIHGGPFAAYGPHFSAEVQLYAAAGYLVVYVNPRGSTSYGEEFANLIHHAYPGGDYDDLMAAVDYTIDTGWGDPEQLYVTGGSGGGILTAWIITRTDRFRAAVAAKPVINWYSFVLTADGYPFFSRYWFEKKPWEDPDAYLSRSPLNFVDQVSTPTMLLTGEEDHRTPISESEQFYQALKLLGVDAALVRVPGASHGIAARPSQLLGKVAHVLAWFERYGAAEEDGEVDAD